MCEILCEARFVHFLITTNPGGKCPLYRGESQGSETLGTSLPDLSSGARIQSLA